MYNPLVSTIDFHVNSYWSKGYSDHINETSIDSKLNLYIKKFPPAFQEEYVHSIEFRKLRYWIRTLQDADLFIVIGIGGSSLGAKAILSYSKLSLSNHKKVLFFEGTHPQILHQNKDLINHSKVNVLWISKSGTTLESRMNYHFLKEYFPQIQDYYFITSQPSKISDLCTDKNRIFHIPEPLGGRFSVFSNVGIIPSLLMNLDVVELLKGFHTGLKNFHTSIPFHNNVAKQKAAQTYSLFKQNYRNICFWVYSKELYDWGNWLVQLWSESLGKTPDIELTPILLQGPEDQHSILQYLIEGPNIFIHEFIHTKGYGNYNTDVFDHNYNLWHILNSQMQSIILALNDKKAPIGKYEFGELYTHHQDNKYKADLFILGKWMAYWMYVVTYVGYLYEINPFNQPGVEQGKVYCKNILDNKINFNVLSENLVL